MKKILFVEDDRNWQMMYREIFAHKARMFHAFTLRQAEIFFAAVQNIDAIVMDGTLEKRHDALGLVVSMRKAGYRGPLIAASAEEDTCELLIAAGCDKSIDGSKSRLGGMLCETLNL